MPRLYSLTSRYTGQLLGGQDGPDLLCDDAVAALHFALTTSSSSPLALTCSTSSDGRTSTRLVGSLGDVPGERVDARAGVPLQGADGGVARTGQQYRGGRTVLGVVCEGTAAEPVERPAVQVLAVVG